MQRNFTISVLLSLYALKTASRAGLPALELWVGAGIDPAMMGEPDGRVSVEEHQRLLAGVARRSGDESFWLRPLEPEDLSQDNITWYYYLNAPDIPQAGRRAETIYRILSDVVYPAHILTEKEFCVRIAVRDPAYRTDIYQVDWGLSQWWGMLQLFAGPLLKLQKVRISDASEQRSRAYRQFFNVPVETGHLHNELVLDAKDYLLPNQRTEIDPNLDTVLQRLLEPALASLTRPSPLKQQFFEVIQGLLLSGAPTIKDVASSMGMSQRTLQRKLADQGITFTDMLSESRVELARSYLDQPHLNITDIALLLGFSETGSFTRIFRKWQGLTPTEYRRNLPD
ncbi:MAG: AraC family transcriptional regulator [Deltaproteobacteria bacterium]|nr:AraC family transcriptional regulator [Deltaproteobacteria bacterium]